MSVLKTILESNEIRVEEPNRANNLLFKKRSVAMSDTSLAFETVYELKSSLWAYYDTTMNSKSMKRDFDTQLVPSPLLQ
jgi:hypothetical protein